MELHTNRQTLIDDRSITNEGKESRAAPLSSPKLCFPSSTK